MNSVLLVSPSSNSYYTLTAPLGLSYIATQLTDKFEVYGLDLNVYKQIYHYSTEELLHLVQTILRDYRIKYVGISILEETLAEATQIAHVCKENNAVCIAGGIYPTLFSESLTDCFDYCIRGDGEFIMRNLLVALENGTSIKGINGLSKYDSGTKKWISFGGACPINCKDDLIPNREIFAHFNRGFKYSSARMLTSRGCIYHCSFCTNRIFQSKYIRRSMDSIFKEVEYLAISGIKEIILSDDQFLGTTPREYGQAISILESMVSSSFLPISPMHR